MLLRRAFSTSVFRVKYGLFINGSEVASENAKTIPIVSPATLETLTCVAAGDQHDMTLAVSSAQKAFKSGIWSKADPRERYNVLNTAANLLRQRIPEFAEKESLQTGRAVREMRAQLTRLPEWFEYYAALIRTHEGSLPPFSGDYINYVKRVPLGVVGQITPWNHPLLIAIKKIAPALAAGNSVVVKPSELAPVCVLELAQLLVEAGLPAGVLNCVSGYGSTAGQALAESSVIKKIDVTGGTPTGRLIGAAAGQNLVGVISELGGKAPMLVFEDADVEQVVNGAAFASFIASGQTCIMGARMIVHESIYTRVVEKFVQKAKSIRLGDPMIMSTQMGPVVSAQQLARVERFVQQAKDEGAVVLCGGQKPEGLDTHLAQGYYYEPTIIGQVTPDMTVVQEEVFGPVVVVYSFKDEADAIRLANDSPFGLAAAIWTKDVKRAHRVAEELDVGIIWVNDHHRNDPSSPWGGMKDSGLGRENGIEALHEYSQSKSVVVSYSDEPFDWFVENDTVRYS